MKFECIVDAVPKAKVTWCFNDQELTLKDKIRFEVDQKTNSNFLIIPKVSSSLNGAFIIRAYNIIGEIEHKFYMNVTGKIGFKNY